MQARVTIQRFPFDALFCIRESNCVRKLCRDWGANAGLASGVLSISVSLLTSQLLPRHSSGITGTDECVTEYEKFKLQNSSSTITKRAYMIFRIKDEKIQLSEQGAAAATWTDFVDALTGNPKDGGYGIFDFSVTTGDGRKLQKIIFIAWAPDSGLPVKQKMMYASAREPFKQQLGSGLAYVIQATAFDELDEETVKEMVIKGR